MRSVKNVYGGMQQSFLTPELKRTENSTIGQVISGDVKTLLHITQYLNMTTLKFEVWKGHLTRLTFTLALNLIFKENLKFIIWLKNWNGGELKWFRGLVKMTHIWVKRNIYNGRWHLQMPYSSNWAKYNKLLQTFVWLNFN